MSRTRVVLWSSVAVMLTSVAAFGQSPPARIGDIYDGMDHQPTAAVRNVERRDGVAPSPRETHREDSTIRQVDRQLLGRKDNLTGSLSSR